MANETSNSYLLVHSQSCSLYTMVTVVGTERVELFVFRLSSEGTAVVLRPLVFDVVSRGDRNRICDLMLPKHALFHLSYTPKVPAERIELSYLGSKPNALPLSDAGVSSRGWI